METKELCEVLVSLGCPPDKSDLLASQLSKRAEQLVQLKGVTYEEALIHLLNLMKQGWAARDNPSTR
jgi:hypothetical protein